MWYQAAILIRLEQDLILLLHRELEVTISRRFLTLKVMHWISFLDNNSNSCFITITISCQVQLMEVRPVPIRLTYHFHCPPISVHTNTQRPAIPAVMPTPMCPPLLMQVLPSWEQLDIIQPSTNNSSNLVLLQQLLVILSETSSAVLQLLT